RTTSPGGCHASGILAAGDVAVVLVGRTGRDVSGFSGLVRTGLPGNEERESPEGLRSVPRGGSLPGVWRVSAAPGSAISPGQGPVDPRAHVDGHQRPVGNLGIGDPAPGRS